MLSPSNTPILLHGNDILSDGDTRDRIRKLKKESRLATPVLRENSDSESSEKEACLLGTLGSSTSACN